MVTAELAVALPALTMFLLLGVTAVDATVQKLRCVDAAREAAVVAARGGSGVAAGTAAAPAGALVRVGGDDLSVTATVTVVLRPLGRLLPGLPVTASAVAAREPGSPP
jgi:hypothetical protein